jgi:hypothetical protein
MPRGSAVDAAFVTDGETSELVEPGEAAHDDPSVTAERLAGLDAATGDAGFDTAAEAGAAAAVDVAGLVGMQLVWPASRAAALAADRRDGVAQVLERPAVVGVGAGQVEGRWNASAIGDQVALGARPAPIRRVRA